MKIEKLNYNKLINWGYSESKNNKENEILKIQKHRKSKRTMKLSFSVATCIFASTKKWHIFKNDLKRKKITKNMSKRWEHYKTNFFFFYFSSLNIFIGGKLYEFARRKPGWRFTAGLEYPSPGDQKLEFWEFFFNSFWVKLSRGRLRHY